MADHNHNFEIRSVDLDQRTLTGIAIPYRQEINVGNYRERIEPGAVDLNSRPKLFFNHTDPIGIVEELRDTDEGLEILARISRTSKGDDTLTLIQDKAITGLSVGFNGLEHRNEGRTIVRTKIDLQEISTVPFPAYTKAQIAEVRNTQTAQQQGENNMEDLLELRNSMEELERRVAMITVAEPAPQYQGSIAEMAKRGVAEPEFIRTLAAATSGADPTALENTYVDYFYNLVNLGRPLAAAFGIGRLPDSGNTVSFLKVTQTADVGKQAAEGNELTSRSLTFTAGTAAVETYGGANKVSRQVIERSDIPYLEALFRSLGIEYAKEIEIDVATDVQAATWVAGPAVPTGAEGRAGNYLKAVAAASAAIYTGSGFNANFVAVPTVEFIDIVSLVDSGGRPIFAVNGDGANTLGNANVAQVQASIAGLPVVHAPALTTGAIYTFAKEAVGVWESPGAPVQLVQEQIATLQKDVAVYGYAADGVRHALAGVKSVVTP